MQNRIQQLLRYHNRIRKFEISKAPTKVKQWEPASSQVLTQKKSIGRNQDMESQASRQSDFYGGWYIELRWGGRYGEEGKSRYADKQDLAIFKQCKHQFKLSEIKWGIMLTVFDTNIHYTYTCNTKQNEILVHKIQRLNGTETEDGKTVF